MDNAYVDVTRIPAVRMCTCMDANLPFFAPLVGVGVAVGIDVIGLESVDGGAHIIIHWYDQYSASSSVPT